MSITVYLGLGSSLGEREQNIATAIERLQSVEVHLVALSPLYESPHLGLQPGDAERYPPHLNCVAQFETSLSPQDLLSRIQKVEDKGGRQRNERWSPRTIDIDILLYGELTLDMENLRIPHPALAERAFVVLPLRDISPHLCIDKGESVAEIATKKGILQQQIQLYKDVSIPNKTEEKSL